MIVPWKVVEYLYSREFPQIVVYENDFPVMNTPGVVNNYEKLY